MAFDDHFDTLAKLASELPEVDILRQKQDRITAQLKAELTPEQYQLILEWDGAVNYLCAVKMEFLYLRGIQDGAHLMKELHSFMTEDV